MAKSKTIKEVLSVRKSQKMNPNETRGVPEERTDFNEDEEQTVCPSCGLEKRHWKANSGAGQEIEGDIYCCRACAQGEDCICVNS